MSSTNETSALGLSQWVLSDPFRMEDFNADNAKIDAAVARKSEFVKLKEITTTTGGVSQIDVDVSDIDFSQWQYVILDTVLTGYANLRVNGKTGANYIGFGYTQWVSGSLASLSTFPQRTVLLSAMQKNARVGTLSVGDAVFLYGQSNDVMYSGLQTLNFVSSSTLAAGSKILLWGVK